jgi:aminoglycoside phosphotransferase (APT) family kinase protein
MTTTDTGIDLEAVIRWLDAQGLPADVTDVEPLSGGSQNIVLRLRVGGTPLILRHPPRHPRPHSNNAIAREMRILRALAGTGVPHPAFYAGAEDPDVLGGATFYLMEAVDGFNPATEVPPAYTADSALVGALGPAIARSLAGLGELDPQTLGLADYGRPDGYADRQITQQVTLWESFNGQPGYDPDWLPEVAQTAAWLRAHAPVPGRAGIVHGDYHLSNLLLRRDRSEVAAIIDWEMSTLGDPLFDLAWLVLTWPRLDGPAEVATGDRLVEVPGLTSRADLVEAYAAASSRAVDDLGWYLALAAFKFGVLVETTHLRSVVGKADPAIGAYTHDLARHLLTLAADVTRGRDPVAE